MQKKSLPFKLSPLWMLVALPSSMAFAQNYLEIPDEKPEKLSQLESIAGHDKSTPPVKPHKISNWIEKQLETTAKLKKESLFDWYVGLAAGRNTGRFLYEKSDLDQFNLGASGFSGQIFLGTGRLFKSGVYSGFELAADISSLQHQDITLEAKWHQENERLNGLYLSLVPGFQWANKDRAYLKVGAAHARIRHATTEAGQNWVGPSHTRYHLGAHWGLGYETPIQKHYSLRFEYLQSMYEAQKSESSQMNDSVDGRWRLVNSDEQFLIGVTYRRDEVNSHNRRHLAGQRINGPYVGLSAARDSYLLYVQHVSPSGTVDDQVQTDSSGYLMSAQAGYAFQPRAYTRYYVAAEGAASISNANDDVGGESRMRILDSYGGSIIPGYRWHDNGLVYAKVGTQYAHFKRQYEVSNDSPQGQLGDGFSARRFGLLLGLGYEVRLDERWSVRGEYQSTQYAPMKVYDGQSMHEWHPRQNLYSLGVIYHWGLAQLFPRKDQPQHHVSDSGNSLHVEKQNVKQSIDNKKVQSTNIFTPLLLAMKHSMLDYYVGAAVGPELSHYRYQKSDGDQFNLGGQGFALRAILGGGWLNRKGWYAGAEFYADLSNAAHKDVSANSRWTQENLRPYGAGASFIPGFQANKYDRWFLKVGIQDSLIRHRVVEGGQDYVGPAFSRYQWGYHYGLGVSSEVLTHWNARIEYARHIYKGKILASNTMNGTTEYGRWRIAPIDDQILVGATYHFPVTHKIVSHPVKRYNWFGPYLGAAISQDVYHIKYRQYSNSNHLSELNRMNASGPQLTATAGFGDLWWRRIYGAAEAAVHYSASTDSLTSTDRFRALESVEGSVLPGYLIRPNSLAYTRFGLNYNHFRHPFLVLNNSPQGNQGPGFELRRWGLRMGLGYEWYLGNHLSVRGEYSYTAYPHVKISADTTLHDWMFHQNLFTLGVNYRFLPKAKSIWRKWHHNEPIQIAQTNKGDATEDLEEADFEVEQLEPETKASSVEDTLLDPAKPPKDSPVIEDTSTDDAEADDVSTVSPATDEASPEDPEVQAPEPKSIEEALPENLSADEDKAKVPDSAVSSEINDESTAVESEQTLNEEEAISEPTNDDDGLPSDIEPPEETAVDSEVWKEVEAVTHQADHESERMNEETSRDIQSKVPAPKVKQVQKDQATPDEKVKPTTLWGKIFWGQGSEYYLGAKLFQESGYYRYQKTDGDQFHLGAQGFGAGVFLGLGRLWGSAYLGAEGFIDYSTAFHRNTSADSKWTQKNTKPFDFGASIIPGWQLTSADRVYIRVGAQNALVKHDTETEGTNWVGPAYAVNKWGYHLGLGVQTKLMTHLDLRFEYKYSLYQGQRAYSATQNNSKSGQWLITPSMDQFGIGVSYHLRKFKGLKLKKVPAPSWQGGYVGGSLGRDTQLLIFNRFSDAGALTQVLRGRAQGFALSAHAGYSHVLFKKFVLGAEVEGAYSTSHDGLTSEEAFKFLDSASASVLPGYQLHDNGLLYARLGVVYGHFNRAYQALNVSPMGTRGLGFDVYRYGVLGGFGYELNIWKRLSLRTEYILTQYNNVTIAHNSETYRWLPTQHWYRLAFNYRF